MSDTRPYGLIDPGPIHVNLAAADLSERAVRRGEGQLTEHGALVALTGSRTGRSPHDRYIVVEPSVRDHVHWGKVNQPMEPAVFDRLHDKILSYLRGRELFAFEGGACADHRHRLGVRVVAEKAWHALFARCLFLRVPSDDPVPLTILNACGLRLDGPADGVRSDAVIALNLEKRLVLIAGTHYAGEIKKSVFAALNYWLPDRGVLPMHCSANIGADGSTALFFGLSGTGKTTLSADPDRRLIGDDEHGWSDEGVFNIEGGCYAKTIRLSAASEPQIYHAIRFGAVLENVVVDPATRQVDYDDQKYTENTRVAYPVDFIDHCELSGCGGHPTNVVFLTCDAFGVLPPLARLSPEQALYHFLSGYTAKVAGTEAGVTEPAMTFSACFGAPFLPRHPARYAELLHQRLRQHRPPVWLVNTGWVGGPHGVGSRIKLAYTRSLLRHALSGALQDVPFKADPVFGLHVPASCPGVPPELLQPRHSWRNPADYDARARFLAGAFQENFQKYASQVGDDVRRAGPHAP